jgi:hypothetical protein
MLHHLHGRRHQPRLSGQRQAKGIGGDRAPLAPWHLRDDLVTLERRRVHHAPEGVTSSLARQRQQTWGLTPP